MDWQTVSETYCRLSYNTTWFTVYISNTQIKTHKKLLSQSTETPQTNQKLQRVLVLVSPSSGRHTYAYNGEILRVALTNPMSVL
jgi:hypothetical protein